MADRLRNRSRMRWIRRRIACEIWLPLPTFVRRARARDQLPTSSTRGRLGRYASRSRWGTEFVAAPYLPRTGRGILSCEGNSASSRRRPLRQRTPVLLQRASSLLPPRSRGRRPARQRCSLTAESARAMSPARSRLRVPPPPPPVSLCSTDTSSRPTPCSPRSRSKQGAQAGLASPHFPLLRSRT